MAKRRQQPIKRKHRRIRRVNGRAQLGRQRVLAYARRKGSITNAQAKKVLGVNQVWYHLDLLCRAGVLKRKKYNRWEPAEQAI